MKIKTLIAILFLSTAITGPAYAAVPSPTQTSTQTENSQINQLKNKIASQVAQLKLVEKRGIIGTIQSVDLSANQITLLDIHDQIRYVDTDDITKYEDANGGSLAVTDMKKGMEISVLGIYNKQSQRILARFVSVEVVPNRFYGEITSIDKTNYDLTVMTDDQKSEKVEIDTSSTVVSYTGGTTLNTYGFSKLSLGDRVEVIGYPDKNDSTSTIADRLIDYLSVPKDPNITVETPTPIMTATPTGKGAKSISPVK
jgi:hypothetical protein